MQALKQSYVDLAHATARYAPILSFSESAKMASPYGWRRWAASLFAIYDTEAMVHLDLPWWNVDATRAVERFLASRPGATVFETGAGASTVWLSRRCSKVVSIEHDEKWYRQFLSMVEGVSCIDLRFRQLGDGGLDDAYVGSIDENEDLYDLIVVDGRHRVQCLNRAMARLSPGGMILFDDSGRNRYRSGIEGCGLRERRYFGRSFCVPYPDHTSLLYRAQS